MAKKEVTVQEPKVLAPAVQGASESLLQRLADVKDNLQSVENYRLPRVKAVEEGFQLSEDDEPMEVLEGVLIHAKKTNVYYDKSYNPGAVEPPRCYSLDGEKPVADLRDKNGNALKSINPTCKGCPMAEFGTNQMKSGKACRNLKPLYLIRKSEDGLAIIPRQLTITPTSLKAANSYLMDLTERGLSYRKVVTRVTAYKENKHDKYCKLKFSMAGRLDPQAAADAEALRSQWLSIMDAQIVDQSEDNSATATPVQATGEF